MRRFELRNSDGVAAAEGVQFSTGECVVSWFTGTFNVHVCADMGVVKDVAGKAIVWIDTDA